MKNIVGLEFILLILKLQKNVVNNFIQIKLNEIKLTRNSAVAVVGGVFFRRACRTGH